MRQFRLIAFLVTVCVVSQGNVFSREGEAVDQELLRRERLNDTLIQGMAPESFFLNETVLEAMQSADVVTREQRQRISQKMEELQQTFIVEMQKVMESPSQLRPENYQDVANHLGIVMTKISHESHQAIKENFRPEKWEAAAKSDFQQFGGTFGGALRTSHLDVLELSEEQKAKTDEIVEKLNQERFLLVLAMRDTEDSIEKLRELTDKLISITRRGQKEIESLLTPEQLEKAKQLMADIPEEFRLFNDYLQNRPWRLDESNWKPGDGPPPNLENYPGEKRPERKPKIRMFPGS